MYTVIPENFHSILQNKDDFLYWSSNIIFDFMSQKDFQVYSNYRYFIFNNGYCAYEVTYKDIPKHLFIFFPGAEVNTQWLANNSFIWRNKDHYLGNRNFIQNGVYSNAQSFVNSSHLLSQVINIHICSFSLGGVSAYFYLLCLLESVYKFPCLKKINLEFYSALGLPEIYRKDLENRINMLCKKHSNIEIYFRYHIVVNDIVPFICNPFLFLKNNINICNNIYNCLYFYYINGIDDIIKSYSNVPLLQIHSRKCHGSMSVRKINLGYFKKIDIFENIDEMYKHTNPYIVHNYKDSICFYNFIIFLYKNYGFSLGLYSFQEFNYLLLMYSKMCSEIISLYMYKNSSTHRSYFYLLTVYEMFLYVVSWLFFSILYFVQLPYKLLITAYQLFFCVLNLIIHMPLLILVVLKDHIRQLLEHS